MVNLFLSDASDSKLVSAGDYDDIKSEENYLRLRLHFLLMILFNQKILISEGWALDSMTFIRVASEVISAIESLRRDGYRSELIGFSPIVMEQRRPGNFGDIFIEYSAREDVRWSGFMPFTHEKSTRKFIYESLRSSLAKNFRIPDAVYSTFSQIMPDDFIAQDMAVVARYFSESQSNASFRMLSVHPPPTAFQESFNAYLRRAAMLSQDFNAAQTTLARIALKVLDQGISFRTSSLAMQFADSQEDSSTRDALMHAINVSYMKVSSDAANAAMSTPAHYADTQIHRTDNLLIESLNLCGKSYDLLFMRGYNPEHDIASKLMVLKLENWRVIWRKAILLAVSPPWREAVNAFSRSIKRQNYELNVEPSAHRKLSELISASVPELSIEYSASKRIFNYTGSESIKKKFSNIGGSVVGAMIAGMVGTGIGSRAPGGSFTGILSAMAVAGGLEFIKSSTKENFPEWLNIISSKGVWAKRSSVFDPELRR